MKKVIGCGILICFVLMQNQFQPLDLKQYEIKKLTVEIKGLVKNPGVYEFHQGESIEQLIEKSGGLVEGADLASINQTKKLINGDVIIISEAKNDCVSLNQATLEELTTLIGIGEAKAKAIIAYRENEGFKNIEDVMNVKGIGEKMFVKFKNQVCL